MRGPDISIIVKVKMARQLENDVDKTWWWTENGEGQKICQRCHSSFLFMKLVRNLQKEQYFVLSRVGVKMSLILDKQIWVAHETPT